jgi:L-rhamnonate dehydratase
MIISDVRACQPPCDSPPDWRTSMGQILVAVKTEAGLVGYGVGGGGAAGVHIVRTVLRDALLGKDNERVEKHWQTMYDATLPFGRKGVAIMALSGVDLALWDLRGKCASQSVAQLLGGPKYPRIPTYATVWDDIPDDLLGKHSAFKIHLGRKSAKDNDIQPLIDRVAKARDQVGPDIALMVDAWMKWDVPFTLRFAEATAQYKLDWIEEPLPPDDLAGYGELAAKCSIPIAGGEHEFTASAFAELMERKLHAVVQPDVCWCGGMTQLVKIYQKAKELGVRVCPHRGAELWGLHAIFALDPQPLAETGRPWMTWVGGQPTIEKGMIELPRGRGFAAQIDRTLFDQK